MNFDKIKNATLPGLPKDLEDAEVSKAYSALEKAHKAFKTKATTFLEGVTEIKGHIGTMHTAVEKVLKNRQKDPKKGKAADDFMKVFGTYKENVTGK